jgi:hypothetical protein
MTQGVTSLLMGHQPPPERISFSLLYISIDLAILLLSALQMWLLVKVFCWRKRVEHLKRHPGVLLTHALLLVAWEIVVPLLLVLGLPLLLNTPWPVMLLYQPDIISWLMAMMLLSIGTATTKTLLVILAWRKRQDQRRPVLQAIRLAEGVATRRNDESKKEATAVGLPVRSWSLEARGSLLPLRLQNRTCGWIGHQRGIVSNPFPMALRSPVDISQLTLRLVVATLAPPQIEGSICSSL